MSANSGILAIDVGSSRVKLGWFPPQGECTTEPSKTTLPIATTPLPQPEETLAVSHANPTSLWASIGTWLTAHCPDSPSGYIASVHPEAMKLIEEMFVGRLRALNLTDLPIEVRVAQPELVGMDRLLNAVAANRIREPSRSAIVVDLGTACTVDWIADDGAFGGGAILPGTTLAAAALHSGTATLPQLELDFSNAPPVVGKSTAEAIASGLHWGTNGAVRELVQLMSRQAAPSPQLFVTGGGAEQIVTHLSDDFPALRHIPHLVLSGIAHVAQELS